METENTELDEQIIKIIEDEDLHTYADIAEEIGVAVNKIFDRLRDMVRRGVLVEVRDTPNRYYLPGTVRPDAEGNHKTEYPNMRAFGASPSKKPRNPRVPTHQTRSKNKVDLAKIEEFAGKGLGHNEIADELGINRSTYYGYRNGSDALAENINSAFKRGQRLGMKKEDLNGNADPKTASPAVHTQPPVDEQGHMATPVALEQGRSADVDYVPKEVESADFDQYIVETDGAHAAAAHLEPEIKAWDPATATEFCELCKEPLHPDMDRYHMDCEMLVARPKPREQILHEGFCIPASIEKNHITSQTIKLSSGIIFVGIYCDLFKASPIERDLIEGIVQLVQAYEEKSVEKGNDSRLN